MQIKIRIQGTEQEVTFMRNILLKTHMNLILSKPREGTNPKYDGNQKWSCYGDFKYDSFALPVKRHRRS